MENKEKFRLEKLKDAVGGFLDDFLSYRDNLLLAVREYNGSEGISVEGQIDMVYMKIFGQGRTPYMKAGMLGLNGLPRNVRAAWERYKQVLPKSEKTEAKKTFRNNFRRLTLDALSSRMARAVMLDDPVLEAIRTYRNKGRNYSEDVIDAIFRVEDPEKVDDYLILVPELIKQFERYAVHARKMERLAAMGLLIRGLGASHPVPTLESRVVESDIYIENLLDDEEKVLEEN